MLTHEWSFLVPATRTKPITATWTATATNADGPPASGTFAVAPAGPDIEVLEAVLGGSA
ncbi:MAG TPA: hypothetical protein VFR67_23900 [Pilimelia sp.]|nr:hypothetical protein [Pilimelia sp.]